MNDLSPDLLQLAPYAAPVLQRNGAVPGVAETVSANGRVPGVTDWNS